MSPDLRGIVLANDVRGVAGEQLDEQVARAFGAAFADSLEVKDLILAHDMRDSSPALARAFADGAARRGARVGLAGLCATDELYCASGLYRAAGAMITASHNPAPYNGIKFCLPGARPVGRDSGLEALRVRAEELLGEGEIPEVPGGHQEELDCLEDYIAILLHLVGIPARRPLRVVVDAGNGMAGLTVPALAERVPTLELIGLHLDLDGSFPHHPADPTDPENLVELSAAVREHGADVGLAFDGDADRCVVVDETGAPVPPSALTALIALAEIDRARAAGDQRPAVVANVVTSRHVRETVESAGGRYVRTPVGHSYIKAVMADEHAVVGGEHSAHYYFRDFFNADSGLLAALHVLAALAGGDRPMSELVAAHSPYAASGEKDLRVADAQAARDTVRAAFEGRRGTEIDELDGLTVTHWGDTGAATTGDAGTAIGTGDADDAVAAGHWWFSLRSSNTEPLLRLNVEAAEGTTMRAVRTEVLALLGEGTGTAEQAEHDAASRSTTAADGGAAQPSRPASAGSTEDALELPSWLREALRCPRCGASLVHDAEQLICADDPSHVFEVRGGVPVLVPEGEVPGAESHG
ncbi:phosphomannomutase/phosphoglucomutase [Brachybacterium endophyticum]|uniref:Phosphomannomutase/phosphoglucomutase n=1 Tax=Brachybacterium endophyticum TaxID=2182385 RepID=A0A2U2RH20_9MICO|nr:phosphomannomutase/phosphoglucomutase [Brachybacterium endophyticum]PWH05150.1 phosphomannomutase/phosphoglucomutase [Brachybacterium endophyticum]